MGVCSSSQLHRGEPSHSQRRILMHEYSAVPSEQTAGYDQYKKSDHFELRGGRYRPLSLKDNCTRAICLVVIRQQKLPPGVPPELIESMINSLVENRVMNKDIFETLAGSEISKISLSKCREVDDEWLQALNKMNCEHLAHMNLTNCWALSESGFQALSNLINLQTVSLKNCFNLRNDALMCLANSSQIRCVDLTNCKQLDFDGLKFMLHLKQLNSLCLKGCSSVDDRAMEEIAKINSLTRLNLSMCNAISEQGFDRVRLLPCLRDLDCGWCRGASGRLLRALAAPPPPPPPAGARPPGGAAAAAAAYCGLEALQLAQAAVANEDLAWLGVGRLSGLRRLGLAGCGGGGGGGGGGGLGGPALRRALAALPGLEALDLGRQPRAGAGGAAAAAGGGPPPRPPPPPPLLPPALAATLTELRAPHSGFTDSTLEELITFSQLKTLDLESCKGVGDRGCAALGTLAGLTSLSLADTGASNAGLRRLFALRGLRELSLFSCDIAEDALTDMGQRYVYGVFENLTSLNLDIRELTTRGFSGISSFHKLKKLDVFSAALDDAALLYLAEIPGLEELDSCGGRLTDTGIQTISTYLKNLTRLNVSQNTRIGNPGAQSLAQLTKLKSLNVSYTSINHIGVKEFKELQNLETLSLYGCSISETDSSELTSVLPSLRCIRL